MWSQDLELSEVNLLLDESAFTATTWTFQPLFLLYELWCGLQIEAEHWFLKLPQLKKKNNNKNPTAFCLIFV